MPAETLAQALKCSTNELNAKTGFDLLYNNTTRFKSITGYREKLAETESVQNIPIIKDSPIMLLDPIKKINEYNFTYSLT
jgi:hypothetical protein